MRTTTISRVGAVAAAVALLVSISPGAAQAARPDPTAAAVARIVNGGYTPADIALVKQDPVLASQVPDPTAPVETSAESSAGLKPASATDAPSATVAETDSSVALLATTYCGEWVRVTYTKKSLTGSIIYKYAQYVQYCRNGSIVTKFESRYDYLAQSSSVVYWREAVVNKYGSVGTYAAWSHFQRHIEYCTVKIACYANTYPWIKITVKANGTYTYTGSAG